VFGEAAIIGQSPRLASALAETDCELLPIARGAFLSLVRLSPEFADTMLTSLAERLRFLTARMN
jgi:CRP-like cAMP-binding protein